MVLLERQYPGTGEGDICSQTTTKYKFSDFFSFFHRVLYLDSFFIEVKHNLYGQLTNKLNRGSHENKYYFSLVW